MPIGFVNVGGFVFASLAVLGFQTAWQLQQLQEKPIVTLSPAGFWDHRSTKAPIPWPAINRIYVLPLIHRNALFLSVDAQVLAKMKRRSGIDWLNFSGQPVQTVIVTTALLEWNVSDLLAAAVIYSHRYGAKT